MPRIFVDECVAGLITAGLREHGFDIADAKQVCPGDEDDRALALAAAAGRILVTEDRGFGELAIRHAQPATGVIVIALYDLPPGTRESVAIRRIVEIIDKAEGHLIVVEPSRSRMPPLPRPGAL